MKSLIVSALRDLLNDCHDHIRDMDSAYGTKEAATLRSRILNAIKLLDKL